jgi:hypothetical protein
MDGLSDPTITDAYGNKKAPVELTTEAFRICF